MANIKTWFQQLFGVSEEQPTPTVPAPVVAQPEPAIAPPAAQSAAGMAPLCSGTFSVGWLTDVGRVRGHNEDALFVFTGEQDASNAAPAFGLFIISDGMGGHQAGEVASSLTVRTVAAHLLAQIYIPLLSGGERGADQPSLTEVMREAITLANRLVTQDLPGSGCTLTCGMIVGDRLFVGHVGDSRAYLSRNSEPLKLITHDHSIVSRLIEMGQLTEEEAAVHPQRNVLYRAIGQGGGLDVDVATYTMQDGDCLLLCTDGLWGMIPDADLVQLCLTDRSLPEVCQQSVDAANAAGGNDNITILLVKIQKNQN